MTRVGLLAAVFVLGAAVSLSGRCTSAEEVKIQDRGGKTVGRIVTETDRTKRIQDTTGVTRGYIRTLPDGRVIVTDKTGVRKFELRK